MIETLLDAAHPLIRVVPYKDYVPFGSTMVAKDATTVVLALHAICVAVDFDDKLPVSCEGDVPLVGGGSVRLRFSMPQVGERDGKLFVTYDVEVVDG